MFEAGSSFRFPAKALQVRFGGPGAEADHLKCDSTIETFLMGAINHPLTATADFFQQFVVAKVPQHFCRARSFLSIQYWQAISFVVKQTKTTLQEASRASFECCIAGDFCSAPSANARH